MGFARWLFYLSVIVLVAIIVLPVPVLRLIKAALYSTFNAIASKLSAVSAPASNSVKAIPANTANAAAAQPPNFTIASNKSSARHKPKNIIINVS